MTSIEDEMRESRRAAEEITEPKKEFIPTIDQKDLRLRQRYAESAFNDKAVSPAGAKGAFQIMQKTQEEYEKKMGETGDIFDPEYNGRMRDRIWSDLYDSFTASTGEPTDTVRTAKTLAMYNRGRGAVGNWLKGLKDSGEDIYKSHAWVDKIPWKETRDYVKFILFGEDIPNSHKTKKKYEEARKKKGL